jgi:hypothetical protein
MGMYILFLKAKMVGCIDVGGSSKMLAIATPPSKKVVSKPNVIDQQAPKHGFGGATYVVLQPQASPINKKLLNMR